VVAWGDRAIRRPELVPRLSQFIEDSVELFLYFGYIRILVREFAGADQIRIALCELGSSRWGYGGGHFPDCHRSMMSDGQLKGAQP
jgi:hypothetical protein